MTGHCRSILSSGGTRHVQPRSLSANLAVGAAADGMAAPRGCGPGGSAGHGPAARRDRWAGHCRLCRRRHSARRTDRFPIGGAAARYARRSGQLDARDHQGNPRQPRTDRHPCHAQRGTRRQRRHLHALRQPRRRDEPGHQPRRRYPRADRRYARRAAGGSTGQASASRRRRRRRHEPQAGQRCVRLHSRTGAIARAQRRVGRAGRARGGQPVGQRGAGTPGGRLHRGGSR